MLKSKVIAQANKQAPWRKKIQLIAIILLGVALFGLVSALYLDVTARGATIGRNVQNLQRAREDLEQEIEDKQSELAYLRSINVMQSRAEKLGFEMLSPGNIMYVVVPNYQGRVEAQLAPSPGSAFNSATRLPESYTQSLFEWFGSVFSVLGGY